MEPIHEKSHIECTPGICGGKPRIAGHRIRVQDIYVCHELKGLSPDEILQTYPTITLADVHAAMTYYWDHREEIDRQMKEDEEFVVSLRASLDRDLSNNSRARILQTVLRFHLDENVDQALAQALSRRGLDVTYPALIGLSGASDEQQIAFALRERRVIVTHDADFLRLASKGMSHSGLAFCHFGARTVGEMLRGLLLLSEFYESEAMLSRVEFL